MQEEHKANSNVMLAESTTKEKQHFSVTFAKTLGPSRRQSISIESTPEDEIHLTFRDDSESGSDPFSEIGKPCEKHMKSVALLKNRIRKKNHGREVGKKDNLSEALGKLNYKFLTANLQGIINLDISNEVLHCLHIIFMYIIRNYFGSPGPKSAGRKELNKYIHILLHEDLKSTKDTLQKSCAIKPPQFVLNVEIIEAVGLDPLGDTGFSFCKAWLSSDPHTIELSEVVEHSGHPVWKTRFAFKIRDWKKDVLYIEIWYSNSQGFVVSPEVGKCSSLYGLLNYCCCLFCNKRNDSSPDFVGKAKVRLSNIFSEGVVQWLLLSSLNGKTEKGRLHIAIKFAVPYFKTRLPAFKRHLLILKICMQESLKTEDNQSKEINSWGQLLNNFALTVVFLHSVISNITVCENVVCRYLIASRIKSHQVTYRFFYAILSETLDCIKQAECIECSLEECLEEVYKQETENLHKKCLRFISELHTYDLVEDKGKREEFEYALRMVYLCEDVTEVPSAPLMLLKSEARNWYEMKAEELMEAAAENKVQYLIQFLDYIIRYQVAVDNIVQNVLPERSYTGLTYDLLAKAFCEPLKCHIKEFASEIIDTKSAVDVNMKREEGLLLFMKIKELFNYLLKFSQKPGSSIQIYRFRDWFGPNVVEGWFKCKQEFAERAIEEILASDNFENKMVVYEGRFLKQSRSVKLTSELIENSLTELWRIVSQPLSNKLDSLFLDALHECCLKYAYIVLDKIKYDSYEEGFTEDGKKALSVLANNLWSLAIFVEKTVNDTVGKLPCHSVDTKLALQTLSMRFCRDIADRAGYFISPLIKDVVCASNENDQQCALKLYANYVQKLLWEEASIDMTFEVFTIFQVELWNAIMKLISNLMNIYETYDKNSMFVGLIAILEATENTCFIDSSGKLSEFLRTEEYKELKVKIQKKLLNI